MAKQQILADRGADRGNDGATGRAGGEAGASRGGGILGVVLMPFEMLGAAIGKAWNAVMADGVIASFGRQGIDELGAALKAFPDSIQRDETGTLWSPTQAEITDSRKHLHADRNASHSSYTPPHPWPSEIARANRQQPGDDHGQDHSQDHGHSL